MLNLKIDEFLLAKAGKATKTLAGYRSVLYLFRDFTGPASWPPTPAQIDAFLNDAKRRGLKESTVEAYYKALKIWLAWLVKRGKLEENPIDQAETPPRPKLLPRAPRRNELQTLFTYLEEKADKGRGHWLDVRSLALWSLALDTGLRVGELAALTIADIAAEKGHRIAFISGGKTHRDRTVVFSKPTAKDLRRWLKVRKGLDLPDAPGDTRRGAGLTALFVSHPRGRWQRLTDWGIRQNLKELCRLAGIGHLSPHQFRNAYAVFSIRNRADLLDVQKQMGHTNISTTNRYLIVADEGREKRHKASSPRGKL
jgi:site-specific recombinase XerD